jgi:DNA adenine methylase
MAFPDTKYMGSKQSLLPWIMRHLDALDYDTALDAFSGSGCVAYEMKLRGKQVVANDLLQFAYHTAKATVANNRVRIGPDDLRILLERNPTAGRFVRDTFRGLYFSDADNAFLDETYANIQGLSGQYRRSIALAALCRACMKKRPRGIFTFTGRKGWDGRRDLALTMRQQFVRAVAELNSAVIDNKRRNAALCGDVFDVARNGFDLVYIDTPYMSPHSDCDYTRRYHFVEGLCSYWAHESIQQHTKTRKIRSRPTAFHSTTTAELAFARLFEHFRHVPVLVVSYSSNGVPGRDAMIRLLRCGRRKVVVSELPHKYCFGNHKHKVGDNNNDVVEYLFIAR